MKRLFVMTSALLLLSCTAESAGERPRTSSAAGESSASVDAAGGDVVFNRGASGEDLELFMLDIDSGIEHEIRETGDIAIVSPDGTAFIGGVVAPDGRFRPETFNADGSGYSVLAIDDPTLLVGDFRWSPDGTRVLSQGWDETDPSRDGLYAFDPSDGGDLTRLTDPGVPHDHPVAYSPDGSRVLFTREVKPYDANGPMNVFVVGADGSGATRLNPPGTTSGLSSNPIIASASWSPDSRQVAFVASKGSFWDDPRALFVADADGANAHRVTPWNCTLNSQWSPNGRWIAFDMCESEGPHDLHVVRPDGTDRTPLTSSKDGRFSFAPVWSPDGASLLFIRSTGDFALSDLWTVNVDGTGLTQVTDSPAEYLGYAWLPEAG